MSRIEGQLWIYLIFDDVSNSFITSSRRITLGDISDAAIFRSLESAEKAIRGMRRWAAQYPGTYGPMELYVTKYRAF